MFTPINYEAVQAMVHQLPRRVQANGFIVLIYLLCQARRKPGRYEGMELHRGDVSTVRRDIPEQIPVSEQGFRTVLNHLEAAGFLSQKLTHPNTVVNICDFNTYVNDNYESNQQVTQKSPTSNPTILDVVVNGKGEMLKESLPTPSEEEMLEQVRATNASNPALESNPTVSTSTDTDFVPDPNFSPATLMTRWRKAGLPMARSIDQLRQENALRQLHHNPPHWKVTEIEQAIEKLIADFHGPKELFWAWDKGPAYLLSQKKDDVQGIEKVFAWKSRSSNGRPAPTPMKRLSDVPKIRDTNWDPITDPKKRREEILMRYPNTTEDPDQGQSYTLSSDYITGRSATP